MSVFSLDDDAAKLMLRLAASAERVDGAVAEAQILTRNINALVTKLNAMMDAFQTAVAAAQKPS